MKHLFELLINYVVEFSVWFWGGFDNKFYTLLMFALVDMILGIFHAVIKKDFLWSRLIQGSMKKIALFIVVGLTNVMESQLINQGSFLLTSAYTFYTSYEALSILNHLQALGLPLPKFLKAIIIRVHNKSNDSLDANNGSKKD